MDCNGPLHPKMYNRYYRSQVQGVYMFDHPGLPRETGIRERWTALLAWKSTMQAACNASGWATTSMFECDVR